MMRAEEMKRLTLQLSSDVRDGRYEADFDLGKSEYGGEFRDLASAYAQRARPILEAYMDRGLITDEELAARTTLGVDRQKLADQLQVLAETLLVD